MAVLAETTVPQMVLGVLTSITLLIALLLILHLIWTQLGPRLRLKCWEFGCFRLPAKTCHAGGDCCGPMCKEHCEGTSFHTYFRGCNTPDGVPEQRKVLERYEREYGVDHPVTTHWRDGMR